MDSDVHVCMGVLWRTGSCSRLVISGSMVRSQPSAYTPRQGILSTIVSLNPGVLNGYLAGFFPQNAPALVKWLQELKPG